ncbi:beta-carotene 3-hydroxylase [Chitinophaga jiangningensis]|uniref:Beta-carotene 3-hydroxylase n=1 Tax=Chitinophaga jiangningensis TaxID=1419482 RepID=A0A1M7A5U0_9BACT|nr:sterol desaturase family protein [Chitinophaga jiangningensis]SHL38082.1 beta-carotene 3-hydroxylase [Chitinophaga jiangningensis]
MNLLINISLVIIAFCTMEAVAWLAHKYIMHGFLWYLHKDHHTHKPGAFEKNDSFFLIFATPSIVLLFAGLRQNFNWMFYVGLGIFFYGLAYFIVHDIIIHQRVRLFTRSNNRYIRAIRLAHKMHHKHLQKENGESFGMLFINRKYWQKIAASKN